MPKIQAIEVITPTELHITFSNGIDKIYNCEKLFTRPQFQLLSTYAFFKAVKIDAGGYGISWNDDMDIGAIELWNNGIEIVNKTRRLERKKL